MARDEAEQAPPRKAGLLGAAILSYGFRVFFLLAGLYAALSMAAWLLWIGLHAMNVQVLKPSIAMPVHLWHGHEMLFGYGLAVIAGFLLTAVPSWTGRRPVAGGLLALLSGAWLAARLASWSSAHLPAALVAGLDLAFIAFLGGLVARALLAGWSPRNLVFLPVLACLLAANLLVHFEMLGLIEDGIAVGLTLALDAILVLIAVLGGRIVPAFTTNALRRTGVERLPRSYKPLEIAALASMVLLLLADLAWPGSKLTGAVAATAALCNGLRMIGWRSRLTLGQPILWILHLAYGWLVLGLLLKAVALLSGALSEITAIHALTVGAIGSMTLGVMSRAGLGHTGRPLVAPAPIVAAYGLVSLAALLRVAGPWLAPGFYNEVVMLAGLTWVAAFAIFSLVFWPILTRPRPSGPGPGP